MEPTHPDRLVENAPAPLRLCARFSGSGWKSQVGNAETFSHELRLFGGGSRSAEAECDHRSAVGAEFSSDYEPGGKIPEGLVGIGRGDGEGNADAFARFDDGDRLLEPGGHTLGCVLDLQLAIGVNAAEVVDPEHACQAGFGGHGPGMAFGPGAFLDLAANAFIGVELQHDGRDL
jgi:hypothetical protein